MRIGKRGLYQAYHSEHISYRSEHGALQNLEK